MRVRRLVLVVLVGEVVRRDIPAAMVMAFVVGAFQGVASWRASREGVGCGFRGCWVLGSALVLVVASEIFSAVVVLVGFSI